VHRLPPGGPPPDPARGPGGNPARLRDGGRRVCLLRAPLHHRQPADLHRNHEPAPDVQPGAGRGLRRLPNRPDRHRDVHLPAIPGSEGPPNPVGEERSPPEGNPLRPFPSVAERRMPMERERQNREEWLRSEGTAFPGKTYVECLLKPLFNDQRDTLLHAMIQVHRAHVLMLYDRRILKRSEAARILRAVEEVARTDPRKLQYDPRYEDLFFLIEAKIAERIGEELAGNMHIARSRNDMGVAMYRIALRERILSLIEKTLSLREALLETVGQHLETVMPAYTLTQPAQPSTLGHYLLAVQDGLARDTARLKNAFHQVNRSPLGSAAITTTGFDICRDAVKEALGFD